MKWVADGFAESRLSEFGCKFQHENVPLSDIDFHDSSMNCARLMDPIQDDLALEYAMAMERGDAFPMPVVLNRPGKGKLTLGGNHRFLAVKTLDSNAVVPCYVVDSDDEMVTDILPRILNRGHGERQSREEAIEHALFMTKKYNLEPKKAESLFGLKANSLYAEIRVRAVRAELEKGGIKVARLTKGVLTQLSPIKNENSLLAAARLLSEKKIPTAAVTEFLTEVKQCRTEGTQLAVVAEWSDRVFPTQKDRRGEALNTNRSRFLLALSLMEKAVNGSKTLSQLQITDRQEAARIKERVGTLLDRLRPLGGAAGGKGRAGATSE